MKTSEIKEDLAQAKSIYRDYHTSAVPTGLLDALCDHIETLLAREAEVLELCDGYDMDLTDSICAILNPEGE